MLASKTWRRSEVPAKRYSPSYNSSINSSLPKNSYILYLFQISETARLKDMYVWFSGHFCQCDSQNARKYSTREISLEIVFPRTTYADSLYLDFYVFGKARIFLKLTVKLNHYNVA